MKQVSIKHCNTSQNTSRNRQNYITRKFYLAPDLVLHLIPTIYFFVIRQVKSFHI